MSLKLSPMLEEDLDAFGILDELAMQDLTFAQLMNNSKRPRREWVAEWARKDWGKDEKAHWLKVTDTETGEMIAASFWRMPVHMEEPHSTRPETSADAEGSLQKEGISDAESRTKKFWKEVEQIKKQLHEEFIGSRTHACQSVHPRSCFIANDVGDLHLLLTHPSYRRRGAGGMLVRWGCDKADEMGIMAACTASAAGEAVYKKNGFEVKKLVELDLSPFGYNEVELRRLMVREPVAGMGAQ